MKLEEGKRERLVRKCLEEVKKRREKKKGTSEWEKERKEFFREKRLDGDEIAWKREIGMQDYEIVEEREKNTKGGKKKNNWKLEL